MTIGLPYPLPELPTAFRSRAVFDELVEHPRGIRPRLADFGRGHGQRTVAAELDGERAQRVRGRDADAVQVPYQRVEPAAEIREQFAPLVLGCALGRPEPAEFVGRLGPRGRDLGGVLL